MSKMRTPKIEVIRFNEADVIVASGGPMGASGFDGNPKNGRGVLNIAGTNYEVSSFVKGAGGLTPFLNAINSNYGTNFAAKSEDGITPGVNLLFSDSAIKTLNDVYNNDNLENGTYSWDSTLGNYGGFRKQ